MFKRAKLDTEELVFYIEASDLKNTLPKDMDIFLNDICERLSANSYYLNHEFHYHGNGADTSSTHPL